MLRSTFNSSRNSWGILGFSIIFEQVSIPPGILQESSRNARNSWGILGFSIFFEQVSIPPGIHQESSRNARNSWGILWFYPIPPGILPFLVGLPGFLEDSSRKRGGSVKFRNLEVLSG
jgi:hypothetical protein